MRYTVEQFEKDYDAGKYEIKHKLNPTIAKWYLDPSGSTPMPGSLKWIIAFILIGVLLSVI